jgi:type III restriction enzyme
MIITHPSGSLLHADSQLEDLDVPLKMERLRQWCEDMNAAQSDRTFDFVYVDEESFNKFKPSSFAQLEAGFLDYK